MVNGLFFTYPYKLSDCRFEAIVAFLEYDPLHILSSHVSECPSSKCGIDLFFKIAAKLLGILSISLDHFFEVTFAEVGDRGRVGQSELLQLLLLGRRYAFVDCLREFVAFGSRSLQTHQGIFTQRDLLRLSFELISVSPGSPAGRHHLEGKAATVTHRVTNLLQLQRFNP
jgi:hypothetical protein